MGSFFPFCTHIQRPVENKTAMQLLVCVRPTRGSLKPSRWGSSRHITWNQLTSFMCKTVQFTHKIERLRRQSAASRVCAAINSPSLPKIQIKKRCVCELSSSIMKIVVGRSYSVQHTYILTYIYMSSAVSRHSDTVTLTMSTCPDRRGSSLLTS